MNKALTVAVAFVAAVGFTGMAAAQTSATVEGTGNDEVAGGNVSNANLTANRDSTDWVGFYGTLDQTVTLSDGNTFYEWTAGNVDGAAILASKSTNSFSGDTSDLSTVSDVDNLNDVPKVGADRVNNTFDDGTGQPSDLSVGATPKAYVNYSSSSADFESFAYNDSSDEPVWVAEAITGSTSYNGEDADYQLLAGAASNDASGADAYSFYAKIE